MFYVYFTTPSGKKIRINLANMESYGVCDDDTSPYNGMTYIIPVGQPDNESPYIVKESIEYIDFLTKPKGVDGNESN